MTDKSIELEERVIVNPITGKKIMKYYYKETGKEVEEEIARALSKEQLKRIYSMSEELSDKLLSLLKNKRYKAFVKELLIENECGALNTCDADALALLIDNIDLLPFDDVSDFKKRGVAEILLEMATKCKRFKTILPWLDYMESPSYQNEKVEHIYGLDYIYLAKGHAYGALGNRETAIWYYKKVNQMDTSYMHHAFAYRGLTTIFGLFSQEGLFFETKAADYFLISGNINEYVRSSIYLANYYERNDLTKAIHLLEEAIECLDKTNLFHKELEGKLLDHIKIIKIKQGRLEEAVNVGINSAQAFISSQVAGNELEIINSIDFVHAMVDDFGNSILADAYEMCKNALTDKETEEKEINESIQKLFIKREESAWLKIKDYLEKSPNPLYQTLYWLGYLIMNENNISFEKRILCLDNAWNATNEIEISLEQKKHIAYLYADEYAQEGECDKAIEWVETALVMCPIDSLSRSFYLDLLIYNRKWDKLINYTTKEIQICGEIPYFLYWTGYALLFSGKANEALPYLLKARKKDSGLPSIDELIDEATNQYDIKSPCVCKITVNEPEMDSRLFDQTLEEFGKYVQSDGRKSFWELDEKRKHKWISCPEKHAQEILHTYLSGRFSSDLEMIEEVGTGAGRIDLYLRFKSGFRMVIELKMCGNGYSRPYAESGVSQAIHYSENKDLNLAYLVVFDSRSLDYGKDIQKQYNENGIIVWTKVIDVRPTVK